MDRPLICLTLTGKTLLENLTLVNKYRSVIDVAELRADFLDDDERLLIRKFPLMAGLPCILTLRRVVDGGQFREGEAARTVLFARALSFAGEENAKTFDYVDFEEDFRVPSLQDVALAFGTKIIRSVHCMDGPVSNITERLRSLRTTSYEIPKIAFMPHSLSDVTKLFAEAEQMNDNNHILIAMGPLGAPSRILSAKLKNYLTFTSAPELASNVGNLAHFDPITLNETYHFKTIDRDTDVFGITGWPLNATSSPVLHNTAYRAHNMNAVYVPLRSEKIGDVFPLARQIGVKGFSVTIPHKESVLGYLDSVDEHVAEIGACNTVVEKDGSWYGYNTDWSGFKRSLLEFTGFKNLRGKRVAIIGAGGAAHAIAYAVKKLHGNACVFNRTLGKARALAEKFGFKYAPLGPDSVHLLKRYSDVIIQTTSKGMNASLPADESNDPIYFYEFSGKEKVFDIVYVPETTPVMARASQAGCKVCNGYEMLKYQGWEQFALFTGVEYNDYNE
ncbi:MAG: shikimate dehydrogenase [Treponema sp.]|nr:shikimate dehydrogenase [Treponema sp.]